MDENPVMWSEFYIDDLILITHIIIKIYYEFNITGMLTKKDKMNFN